MSLDHATSKVKHQTATRDAFLGGRLTLAQPKQGFRAGLDSVVLGAAVRAETGELLDLGAGVGTAALVTLTHRPDFSATLVENDPGALALLSENITGNGFADRAVAIDLDVTAPGATRLAAGLKVDHYATVIANPPFFAAGQGTLARGAGRSAARHMAATELDQWVKTAAAAAAPDAEVIFIYPAESLVPLLAAFDARFGALTILPLSPRPETAVTRVLVRGIKGSRAPLTLLSTRPIHGADGNAFSPEFEAVLRGAATLLW